MNGTQDATIIPVSKEAYMQFGQATHLQEHTNGFFNAYTSEQFENYSNLISNEEIREFFSKDYKKVLVLEDDDFQFSIIEELLLEINENIEIDRELDEHHGIYRFDKTINNPREKNYDLIISDIVLLNNTSGLRVVNHCKFISPDTKCLLVSALSLSKIFLKENKNNNVNVDIIPKPIEFNLFHELVSPALN